MKTVQSGLCFNKKDLDLYIDIESEGRTIVSQKANCLLDNFLKFLHSRMGGVCSNSVQSYRSTNPFVFTERLLDVSSSSLGRANYAYASAGIICGSGTTAVALTDYQLKTVINSGTSAGMLSYGASSLVAAPANGEDYTQITVSRAFTNATASPVAINEIGLMLYALKESYLYDCFFMAARDVISAVTVQPGVTVTVNYKIRATKSSTGGFTRGFMSLLYRQLADTAQAWQDINNSSESGTGHTYNLWLAVGGGAEERYITSSLFLKAENTGVVVGGGDNVFNLDDYALETKLPNSALKHYGNSVSAITTGVSESSFLIERIFQNISGSSVTVSECGLYAFGGTSSSISQFCIARNVLPSPVSLNDGEYLKVTYQIKVAV